MQPILPLMGLAFVLSTIACTAQEKGKKAPPIPDGVAVERDIIYATHDGIELRLDLYRPEKRGSTPLPAVMWVHGGGWLQGSKENCKAAFLAQRGFAVASIQYRLADSARWPSQIEDCKAAVRWLRSRSAEYGLDGDHIGAWGGSAGGHLVALLGTRPTGDEEISSRVQAVCDWYGPSDLLTMPPNVVSETRSLEQVANSNGAKLLGATVRDVPDLARDASALHQVSPVDAPFLIMHGSEDPGVPVEQSLKLHEALRKAGVESELAIVEGAGHGGPGFATAEVQDKVAAFFERHLK